MPPDGWSGWPHGKRFAVVLTHDVEGSVGLQQCRLLAELEIAHGMRSSFNFVPEGEYTVDEPLLDWLRERDFEIGVHGLRHDGRLYWSRKGFSAQASRINQYLKKWEAVGFRSPFMQHNLEWIHDLDIEYDSSTFDTDPFEPQPDGVGTVFPFWVPKTKDELGPRCGYVELPYTLVQDSTLFLFLSEQNNDIWKQKLEWIASNGGMALLITHPDYMDFGNGSSVDQYRINLYTDFLKHVQTKYSGEYWLALPRQVSAFVRVEQTHGRVLPFERLGACRVNHAKSDDIENYVVKK